MDYVEPYGRAGAPISSCEIKLVSKGSYSVNHNPPQGELCVKGDNISLGYYEMPEKTKEDFEEVDGERWFHTGDAAQLNPDGTFSIIGRVKDIFKLDGGEYIAYVFFLLFYTQHYPTA
jgi:long-chain acyl-CoA synthetase